MVIVIGMFISHLLWGQINTGLTFSFSGEWEDDACLRSLWEWGLSEESERNRSIFCRWEGEPFSSDETVEEKTLRNLGCTLKTPFFSAGSLDLDGCYDIIESEDFLSATVLREGGDYSLDREGTLYKKRGISLHSTSDNLIFHYLYRNDYSQAGLLWQSPSERALSGIGALFYSWNGQYSREEDSWYAKADGRTGESLSHLLLQIRFDKSTLGREWILSLTGAGCAARNMLFGYAGFLFMEGKGPEGFLALSLQANGGLWRNCRGEPAEWSRGIGWKGEVFSGRPLVLASSGCLYSPGVFELSSGDPSEEFFSAREGSITLKGPFFSCAWEGESHLIEDSREQSVDGRLFLEKDGLRGTASFQVDWNDSPEQQWEGEIRWKRESFRLEGSCGWTWEEGEAYVSGEPFWKGKIHWYSFPPGVVSLEIEGGEGMISGELRFKKGIN